MGTFFIGDILSELSQPINEGQKFFEITLEHDDDETDALMFDPIDSSDDEFFGFEPYTVTSLKPGDDGSLHAECVNDGFTPVHHIFSRDDVSLLKLALDNALDYLKVQKDLKSTPSAKKKIIQDDAIRMRNMQALLSGLLKK